MWLWLAQICSRVWETPTLRVISSRVRWSRVIWVTLWVREASILRATLRLIPQATIFWEWGAPILLGIGSLIPRAPNSTSHYPPGVSNSKATSQFVSKDKNIFHQLAFLECERLSFYWSVLSECERLSFHWSLIFEYGSLQQLTPHIQKVVTDKMRGVGIRRRLTNNKQVLSSGKDSWNGRFSHCRAFLTFQKKDGSSPGTAWELRPAAIGPLHIRKLTRWWDTVNL